MALEIDSCEPSSARSRHVQKAPLIGTCYGVLLPRGNLAAKASTRKVQFSAFAICLEGSLLVLTASRSISVKLISLRIPFGSP